MRISRVTVAAAALAVASSAAAQFRAADLVVVPVAASLPGLNDSDWRSDLEITNVEASDAIDVLIVFLPSGFSDNQAWYRNLDNHLSGRAGDGFGKIDTKLKDIAAGRTVYIEDPIKTHWNDNAKGALLVFAYKAGTYKTTTPPGGEPRNVVVRTRTYTLGQTAGAEPKPTTYGQGIPGIPWYLYIDSSKEASGLNKAVFSGVRQDASYRTAIGLVNVSDFATSLYVELSLTAEDGTLIRRVIGFLDPLAHKQYDNAASSLFGLATDATLLNASVTVRVSGWTSPIEDPTPALIVYGSRVDNTTNDPVYLEQIFAKPLDWDCVFNGNCGGAAALSAPLAKPRHRPLAPPY